MLSEEMFQEKTLYLNVCIVRVYTKGKSGQQCEWAVGDILLDVSLI